MRCGYFGPKKQRAKPTVGRILDLVARACLRHTIEEISEWTVEQLEENSSENFDS